MRLRYTRQAAVELLEVLTFIEAESANGARRVQARIKAVLDLLLQHPEMGRLTDFGRLPRMSVTPYPYLIFYEAT